MVRFFKGNTVKFPKLKSISIFSPFVEFCACTHPDDNDPFCVYLRVCYKSWKENHINKEREQKKKEDISNCYIK